MREADYRLICAKNRDPLEAKSDRDMREELYYRINTIEIRIPPLRERMDDVPVLAEHFLKQFAAKYDRPNMRFSTRCYDQMLRYHWRGNVRELQNTIERAVLLAKNGTIERLDLPTESNSDIPSQPSEYAVVDTYHSKNGLDLSGLSEKEMFEVTGKMIVDRLPETTPESERKDVFGEVERGIAMAALQRTRGNKQAAANLLGIYRPRLYGILKRHKIEEGE
jgi:DNA-binding NtrC family response regulator